MTAKLQDGAPRVTVALPTYRPGPFLWPAVRSILDQTMPDFELLIFDDWGGDEAVAQIAALQDPRITIIDDGQNAGLAARLNQAIAMARGHYFARMDHDDIAHPERLEKQINFLMQRPDVDLLGTGCITMDENSQLTGHLPLAVNHQDITRRPWLGIYVPHPTWMARHEWFAQHRYSSLSPYFSEDQELLLRVHENSHYHVLPEPLLAYRVRSSWTFSKRLKTRFAVLKLQLVYFAGRIRLATAGLSFLAFLLRVLNDLVAWVGLGNSAERKLIGRDQRSVWDAIIQQAGRDAPGGGQ